MPLISKPNYNQIFASQAPEQDKPAVFNNYPLGWGVESRPNNGKPTIKGFNYLQQTSDLKDLWILQNGACLPYDESIEYADGAPVLKDGVIQYKTAGGFKSRDAVSIPTYNNAADGVDPVTGVADGAYFNVRSSSDESYIDEYQNVGGIALATGKSYLSALGVQQQEKPATTIKDASGKNQQQINDLTVKFATNIANLRTMDTDKDAIYQTLGYVLPNDKGSSRYYADLSDTTSEDDGFSVIVGTDGTRWKLLLSDELNIAQVGIIGSNLNLDTKFNAASLYCSLNGIPKLKLNKASYTASQTLNIYSGVLVYGCGMGMTAVRSIAADYVMKRERRPDQTSSTYIVGANIADFTIVSDLTTKTAKLLTGVRYRNCYEQGVEFARGSVGLSLGDGEGGGPQGGEQYHNRTVQCRFASNLTDIKFCGASNRNTFDTNTHLSSEITYDFGTVGNVSETNTFINENVEGSKRWAKWGIYIERVYKQTWIGLTVENPTSNPYSCIFEDAGSQVFVNLALIGSVTQSRKFGNRRSIILGMPTGGAQHLNPPSEIYGGLDVYGDLTRAMGGLQVRGKIQHYSTTSVASIPLAGTIVPAGLSVAKTVAMPDLVRGNILSYGLNFDPSGLTFTPYCNADGTAFVKIRNVTTEDITITAGTIVLNCVVALVT